MRDQKEGLSLRATMVKYLSILFEPPWKYRRIKVIMTVKQGDLSNKSKL